MIIKSSYPLKDKIPDFIIRTEGKTTFCYREVQRERYS